MLMLKSSNNHFGHHRLRWPRKWQARLQGDKTMFGLMLIRQAFLQVYYFYCFEKMLTGSGWLRQAFFCAPLKKTQGRPNSRNRKLKKITQNSCKNLHFPAFLDQNLKDTFWKIAQLIAKSNSQGRKITHFFPINNVFKLKTQIFQRFPPKTQ